MTTAAGRMGKVLNKGNRCKLFVNMFTLFQIKMASDVRATTVSAVQVHKDTYDNTVQEGHAAEQSQARARAQPSSCCVSTLISRL